MTEVVSFGAEVADPITGFDAVSAAAVHLGSGDGPAHCYVVHVEPGGRIGEHETGFAQLFIVVSGAGWVKVDGMLHRAEAGQAVVLPRGVMHEKGSEDGMVAVMVQMYDMADQP